jgi:hypothetical protein
MSRASLTYRPYGSTPVGLDTLNEAIAVLCGGGRESLAVQGLVVEIDIVQAVQAAVCGFDLAYPLFCRLF